MPESSESLTFLSLPPEIRLQIYHVCTTNTQLDDCVRNPYIVGGANLYTRQDEACTKCLDIHLYFPLLRTCSLIRKEAIPVFDNHAQCIPSIPRLYAFLRSIGRTRRLQLRRLTFAFTILDSGPTHLQPVHPIAQWEEVNSWILAKTCFRLILRECRALQSLHVYLDKSAYRGERVPCGGLWPIHIDPNFNGLLSAFKILRSVRGLRDVEFTPLFSEFDFDDGLREELSGYAQDMKMPKKEKRPKEDEAGPAKRKKRRKLFT